MVLRSFGEMLRAGSRSGRVPRAAEPAQRELADNIDFERAQRAIIAGLTRQDLPPEVGADLLFSNVRVNVEGDDAGGYRVQLRAAGDTQTFYVVRKTARTAS